MQLPHLNGAGTEHYKNHIREYLEDDIVVVRGSGEMSREATDAFAELLLDTVYRAEGSLQMVMDVSHRNQGFAPYSVYKMNHVLKQISDETQLWIAVIIKNFVTARLVDVFLRRKFGRNKKRHFRIWADFDKGLTWLQNNNSQIRR